MPHGSRQTQSCGRVRRLSFLPRAVLGVRPHCHKPRVRIVPCATAEASPGRLSSVPRQGRCFLGVQTPRGEFGVQQVSQPTCPPPIRHVLRMPPFRQNVGIPPSLGLKLLLMPPSPGRASFRCMQFVSSAKRCVVGVRASDFVEMFLLPSCPGEALRFKLLVVPLAAACLAQRNVQAPENLRRRTLIPELRLQQLPSERLLVRYLRQVPRFIERPARRLDTVEMSYALTSACASGSSGFTRTASENR